ncbi:protein of unknown function [Sphingobium sp. AP50]|nr:protein of unknown function [Sphingobium sp. AP50]
MVRAGGEKFLPRLPSVDVAQHKAIIERTAFFPGASRTHEGLMGLLFRKPPKVDAEERFLTLLNTIKADAGPIEDLAEDVADELLSVNFGLLLTDLPASSQAMSVAEEEKLGIRPRILIYRAEAILGIDVGLVNNRQQAVNIRLQQDVDTIRELMLVNGVYQVRLWTRTKVKGNRQSQWLPGPAITPTRLGQAIDEIPATVITLGRRLRPSTAPLTDVCDLNRSHYHASANLATCDYWLSNPIPWTTGAKPRDDVAISPGTMWQFEEENAKVGMLEYTGAQAAQLESRANNLRDYMASAGARILAPEKAAVESGQALEIRNAAQTASLDQVRRTTNRIILDQIQWAAWWAGADETQVVFEMSGDFTSAKLSSEERKQIVAEWQAGLYSHEQAIERMVAGGALPEDFDIEADKDRMAMEAADRPPVDTFSDNQFAVGVADSM